MSLFIKSGSESGVREIILCHTPVADFLHLLLMNCNCLYQHWVWYHEFLNLSNKFNICCMSSVYSLTLTKQRHETVGR